MNKRIKKMISVLLLMILIATIGFTEKHSMVSHAAGAQPTVQYQVHVQKKGWIGSVTQGAAGTTGQALRLEAIRIEVKGVQGLGVRYQTHVQTYGWQNYVSDGATAGTVGQSKRLEAIRIELTGAQAANYDIYYRVHAQTFGWMNWAKNGEAAGTQSYGKRLEAIEIRILPKGSATPTGGSGAAFSERKAIAMTAHVQSYGWLSEVDAASGTILGTTGKGKRLEAISLKPVGYDMNVEYSVHVQSYGWSGYAKNGQTAGTTGQGKRLEAVKIRLSGTDAAKYDIYYRAHVQSFGWLDWAKNDETAGTVGHGLRMEALEVRLVPKGSAAPGSTERACVTSLPKVAYQVIVQDQGWQNERADQQTAGTTGQGRSMQALKIRTSGDDRLGVEYSVYQNGAWTAFAANGAQAGTQGSTIEAVKIRLTGADASAYNIYYRIHSQTVGWLDWASNGNPAGTTKINKGAQAIEIVIRSKAQAAPGSTANAYRENLDTEAESYARQTLNRIGWNLRAAFTYSSTMPYFTNSTVVPAGYTNADWYAIYGFKNGRGNCYNQAATFYQMAKLLGYDVHYLQGYVPNSSGGKTTHGWCEINMDGGTYVFDPNFTYWKGVDGYHIYYGKPGTWRYMDYQRLN